MTRKCILKRQRIQEDKSQMKIKESLSLKRQKLVENTSIGSISKRTRNYEKCQENFDKITTKNTSKILVDYDESDLNSVYRKLKSKTTNFYKAEELNNFLLSSVEDKFQIITALVGVNQLLSLNSNISNKDYIDFFLNNRTLEKIIVIIQNMAQDNSGAGLYRSILIVESIEILEKVTKNKYEALNLYLYEKGLLNILIKLFHRLGAFNIIKSLILLINNLSQNDSLGVYSSFLNQGYLKILIQILNDEKYKDLRKFTLDSIINIIKKSKDKDLYPHSEDIHDLLKFLIHKRNFHNLNFYQEFKSETENLLYIILGKIKFNEKLNFMLNSCNKVNVDLETSFIFNLNNRNYDYSQEIKDVQETLKKMKINSDIPTIINNISMDFCDLTTNENWTSAEFTEREMNSEFKLLYQDNGKIFSDEDRTVSICLPINYHSISKYTSPVDSDVSMNLKSEFFN